MTGVRVCVCVFATTARIGSKVTQPCHGDTYMVVAGRIDPFIIIIIGTFVRDA